jgi:hypothetical protein
MEEAFFGRPDKAHDPDVGRLLRGETTDDGVTSNASEEWAELNR